MSDFWNPKVDRKARKQYSCVWCGQLIEVGEPHSYQTGRFDGEFQHNRWHRECWDGADWEEIQDGFTLYGGERPERPCTCHPDDNPPKPCATQYALGECKAAHALGPNV